MGIFKKIKRFSSYLCVLIIKSTEGKIKIVQRGKGKNVG